MNNKAIIAMSGGVDSSVAALLMLQSGYDCIGAMMKLFSGDDIGMDMESGCCSLADAEDARAVAYRIGIPFYVFNFSDLFREHVIERFITAYQSGHTPNPCLDCNRHLKFTKFLSRARELGCDTIATGHYARIEADPASGRYLLKKGIDESKDQSYFLYSMTQEQLKHTSFPLGGLNKTQVRAIAEEHSFTNAKKSESQDICFVKDGDYAGFIEQYTGRESERGSFMDTNGNIIGTHNGIVRYTIGQRKGLGLSSPRPLYVCSKCAQSNVVVVGAEEELYSKSLTATDVNLIPFEKLDGSLRVAAKIRHGQPEQPATLYQSGDDTIQVIFDRPQRAVATGQAVVLYDGDTVLGGGTITSASN